MKELIKIEKREDKEVVSARSLYEFLEVKTDFTEWCKRMFSYGFENGVDYSLLKIGERNAHNKVDYALTLDTAKEISMLQRSEKGKQARQYFIECEKKLKGNLEVPTSFKDALLLAAKLEEEKEQAQLQLQAANTTILALEPKRIFADAVSASKTTILVGELAKILKQNGIDIGQNRLFEWMRTRGYLINRKGGSDFNMPTQKSMNSDLFEIKETVIAHSDGHTSISKTAKVTGKGQNYFINKFLNKVDNETQLEFHNN